MLLLAAPSIYRTSHIRERYEVRAKSDVRPQSGQRHAGRRRISGRNHAAREDAGRCSYVLPSGARFRFQYFSGCHDDVTLFELARAAHIVGGRDEAAVLLGRARKAGSLERFEVTEHV
jgi:hypothetical protein